jgi:hypothetical protein
VFRDKKYGFGIGSQVAHDESPSGQRSLRMVRRALPGSLTLAPGERIEGLHPAIEKVTQVAALLARKQVAIEAMETAKTQPAPHPPQVETTRARLGAKHESQGRG